MFKGDRKPFALFKGDKQITGAVKTHLEGTDIVKWESPYKAEIPNVETEGLGKQDKLSGKNLHPMAYFEVKNTLFNGFRVRIPCEDLIGKQMTFSMFIDNTKGDGKSYVNLWYIDVNNKVIYMGVKGNDVEKGKTGYSSATFVVKKEMHELALGAWLDASHNCEVSGYEVQLEQGTQATEYEPYCGGIPAPNPQYPIEPKFNSGNRFKINTPPQEIDIPILRAIPNTEFKDTYDVQRGIITRRVEEMTLTGEEDWWDFQTSIWYQVYLNVSQHLPKPNYKDAFAMCAKFMPIPMDSRDKIDNGVYTSTSAICFNPNFVKTIYEWKLWLKEQYNKGTPLKIWYALKNPYEEKISTTPLRQDWNGQLMQTGGDCGYAPMRADVFTEFKR